MGATRTREPGTLTPRGRIVLIVALLAIVGAGFVWLRPSTKTTPPRPVPSFDGPLGAFDASKVPNSWGPLVAAAAKQAGIPAPVLAAQLEVESGWDPRAVSRVGAQGLAQFTPDTWKTYGSGDPFDPEDAIAAQGRLMKVLMRRANASGLHDNHVKLALAGYNAGFGNVTKYRGVPPFPETENYVDSVAWSMGYYAKPLPKPSSSGSGSDTPSSSRASATPASSR